MSYSNYQSRKVPGFVSYIAALIRFRHLCWNLVGSDLRSRFRRSRLGILWAIIQPLGYSIIIAWAWGTIFKVPSYLEFAIYVFSGMIVWEYYMSIINVGMDSLVNSVGYLRQSRIPFFIFQLRVPLSALVIFGAGVIGLYLLMAVFQLIPPPGPHLLLVPAFMGVLIVVFAPLAVFFSVLGAQLRDLKHIMTLVLQAQFFLSPVMMQRELMSEGQLQILQYVNPLVPIIDLFRDPVVNGQMWKETDIILVSVWAGIFWMLAIVAAVSGGRRIVFAL